MKKNVLLLVLIGFVSLVSCTAPAPPSPFDRAEPPQAGDSWVTPDPSLITLPVNLTPDPILPPGWTVSPVTFGGPVWLEVTAIPAPRSPGDGASCMGVASEDEQHRLWIRSANCGSAGSATVTVTLGGQATPQLIGDQDLMLVQLDAGKIVPVTAVVKVGKEQIWPPLPPGARPNGYQIWAS